METKVRIVNKSEEGVLIAFKNKKQKSLSWEEFNRLFKIESKIWGILRDNVKSEFERLDEILEKTVKSYKTPDFEKNLEELAKELGCTIEEANEEVKKRLPKEKKSKRAFATFGDLPELKELKKKRN